MESDAVSWTDEQGTQYIIQRVTNSVVSVSLGEKAIGRVPVPASLPPLGDASRAELRAVVQAALRRRQVGRWENEGGAVDEDSAHREE